MIVAASIALAVPVALLAARVAVAAYRGAERARRCDAPAVGLLVALCGLLAVYAMAQSLALVPYLLVGGPA